MILIKLINLSALTALRLSCSDNADATVKIAIPPVKNAFLREEIREFLSENRKKM